MPLPRHAGRRGRPWLRLRAQVLAESDRCCWCGHGGSNAVNHTYPLSRYPWLAHTRDNLMPVHGIEGCPQCAPHERTGKRRACNTEIGNRILGVEAHPPGPRLPGVPQPGRTTAGRSRGGRTGRTHAGTRRHTRVTTTPRTSQPMRGSRDW